MLAPLTSSARNAAATWSETSETPAAGNFATAVTEVPATAGRVEIAIGIASLLWAFSTHGFFRKSEKSIPVGMTTSPARSTA